MKRKANKEKMKICLVGSSGGHENIFSDKKDCLISKEKVLREYLMGHSVVSMCGKIVKRICIDIKQDYSEYGRLSTGEDTLLFE